MTSAGEVQAGLDLGPKPLIGVHQGFPVSGEVGPPAAGSASMGLYNRKPEPLLHMLHMLPCQPVAHTQPPGGCKE